jgi:hypothetical protein
MPKSAKCPKCSKRLTVEHIRALMVSLPLEQRLSLRGSLNVSMRETAGTGGGRPRSDLPRCACGAMTQTRAETRKHVCERPPEKTPPS